MGYAQWICMTIRNEGSSEIFIEDASLRWGKFHEPGNLNTEISRAAISGLSIPPHAAITIASCGREHTWSGTEGTLNFKDSAGQLIRQLYWLCPHSTLTNIINPSNTHEGSNEWTVDVTGANYDGESIGNCTLVFRAV